MCKAMHAQFRDCKHFAMFSPEELPDTVMFSGNDDDDVCTEMRMAQQL